MKVIYEVNLVIDNAILHAYEAWLTDHVQVLLNIEGFEEAKILKQYDAEDENHVNDGRTHITVLYTLNSEEAMKHYLSEHAAKMRGEIPDAFIGKFSATRRMFKYAA